MSTELAVLPLIVSRFRIPGDYVSGEPYGSGHINETFAVTIDQGGSRLRYVLQRLNTDIFKTPRDLMENVVNVTEHIRSRPRPRGKLDASRRVLTLVPTAGGPDGHFVDDPELGFWRCYLFIEGARTYDLIKQPRQAFEAARAIGTFQRLLADYEGPRLKETIPCFHHTRNRFEAFRAAVAADPLGRARGVQAEIEFAFGREPIVDHLLRLQAAGDIPERITHNDTKLNNVMLDDRTGEGVCVLDLDTVMPGLSLYDFGDMVRTACNPVAEDEPDTSKVIAREDMFEALAKGYLEGTAGALLPVERENLVVSGQLLTFECGLRFLTDHLLGDAYFRIHREGHNLDRTRTQFALMRSLELQADPFMRTAAAHAR